MRLSWDLNLLTLMLLVVPRTGLVFAQKKGEPTPSAELIRVAVQKLVQMQEANGLWPYECFDGIHVVNDVANTSIVAQALLIAAPKDKNAQAAVQRGLGFILGRLNDFEMGEKAKHSPVWGHNYALEFLCRIRASKKGGQYEKKVDEWIPRLVEMLVKEQHSNGGWTYQYYLSHPQSFVTAPVTQTLLLAREQGAKVPDELLKRCRKALETNRLESGAFTYEGSAAEVEFKAKRKRRLDSLVGSASRSPLCETTLVLLGGGSIDFVRFAVHNFHKHWAELEEHSKRGSTHAGPYLIAPYFFYFGHRYVAQAIQLLPEPERVKERERLLKLILQTRDADGTWNDRIFPCDSSYGTAMVVLALLGDRVPLPSRIGALSDKASRKDGPASPSKSSARP